MTSGLRKAHKYVWLLIAIIVPVLIVFSIKDLDIFSSKRDGTVAIDATTIDVLKVAENDFIKASLIKKENGNSLEIILKSALKHPSSVVYDLDENDNKGTPIGQLTTVGIYHFEIKMPLEGIVIYDTLKETVITKLTF